MSEAALSDEVDATCSEAYLKAVNQLYALGQELAPLPPLPDGTPAPHRKWDLENMRTLCAALGNPQDTFASVLIAGTNGKGSTAATLASILASAGYRTGLYTSPHLVRVNERIVLAGPDGSSQITDDAFARLFARVDEVANTLVANAELPVHPSFFEMLTALGFLYFSEEKVDIAILEVGLGGRLDATNIVEPLVSVITDIALDHQEYLGETIAEITREKAGILRHNGILVTLPQHPQANQAIGEAAAELNLRAFSAADFIPRQTGAMPLSSSSSSSLGILPRNRYDITLEELALEIDSPLAGHHQQRNLALAIATARVLRNHKGYKIVDSAIQSGIRNTHWPGRLEVVSPNLLLDVAHNPAGAWTLRAAIAQLPEDRPRTLIFSCLSDKNLSEMSRILFPLFDSSPDGGRPHDHIVLAPIANPRAAKVENLLDAARALDVPAHVAPHLEGALAQARQITPTDGLIIATGSVYLVGAIRDLVTRSFGAD